MTVAPIASPNAIPLWQRLLVHVVFGVLRVWGGRLPRWSSQALALTMAAVIVTAGCTSRGGSAEQSPESHALPNLKALADPDQLPSMFEAIDKLQAATDRSAFDVNAMADKLGSDPEKTFAFVRDDVRFEAYEGVLRGPAGTLMALAGNSYDKSLLLAALLRHDGIEVRFAHGRLGQDKTTTLVTQMFAQVQRVSKSPASPLPSDVPATVAAAAHELVKDSVNSWTSNVKTLQTAVAQGRIQLDQDLPTTDRVLVAETLDHVWVQYKNGDTWISLDSSFENARPAQAFAEVAETWPDIPSSLFHTVRTRVKVEERLGKSVTLKDVLSYQATAADLNGTNVQLWFSSSPNGSKWSARPILVVGDERHEGEAFGAAEAALPGIENVAPGASHAGCLGGGAAGGCGFSGEMGAGEQASPRPSVSPAETEPQISAVWLEFDFIYPSGLTETERREIFDRVGPTARAEKQEAEAALMSVPLTGGVPVPLTGLYVLSFSSGSLHPAIFLASIASHSADGHTIWNFMHQAAGQKPSDDEAKQVYKAVSAVFPPLLEALAQSFQVQSQKAVIFLYRTTGVWFYEATPRLAIASVVASGAGDREPSLRVSLDLRRNVLRPVAENVPGQKVIWANVERGIADAALEYSLLAGPAPAGVPEAVTTTAVMDLARTSDTGFSTLTTRDDAERLVAPDQAKSRLLATLGDNIIVLSPTHAVRIGGSERLGWWRVDRKSGDTLGIMDTGLNQGDVEYNARQAQYARWNDNINWLRRLDYGSRATRAHTLILGPPDWSLDMGVIGMMYAAIAAGFAAFVAINWE